MALVLIGSAGCQSSSEDAGSESSSTASAERRFLSIGTAPPGGAFFVIGGALSEVLNVHSGQDGWQFTAEATKGSKENIRRLISGDLDLALSNAAITYFAVRGGADWEAPHPVRSIMTLAPNVAMFLTQRDSGIRSIADLAGKRVTIGPAGAGFEDFLTPILAAHDITFDDFTPLSAIQSTAVGMLADGSSDAAFLGGVVPTASVTQAATSQDIFFVPYDPDAVAALDEDFEAFRPTTVAAGTYKGMDDDFHGLVVGDLHLIVAADADEELVYVMTKTLFESAEQVIERHGVGRAITAANVVRATGTDFHPGAIRFYREAGIWPEESAGE
jgi:TRAP transporter TAXI family solute receptor